MDIVTYFEIYEDYMDIVTYCEIYDCKDCPRYGDYCDGKADDDDELAQSGYQNKAR